MDKNKGFTLIELLAVIVILAIIALITTPLIMRVIIDARKNSAKDSVYGYIEAVEYGIVESIANNPEANYNGEFTVEGGKIVQNDVEIPVKYKGTPLTGTVQIEDNRVVSADLTNDSYYLVYDGTNVTVESKEDVVTTLYADGTVVYFNPETGEMCEESESVSTNGTKSGCMKWYTFGDKEGSPRIKLLLDHNTSDSEWISMEDFIASGGTEENWYEGNGNVYGPVTANKNFKNDTSTWKSGLNPRLITANEIASITGNTSFDSATSTVDKWFYLGTNDQGESLGVTEWPQTDEEWAKIKEYNSKYGWLFDRLFDCEEAGCNTGDDNASDGYWTNDSLPNMMSYSTRAIGRMSGAWRVFCAGVLEGAYIRNVYGLRPVITVSKSSLK